MCVNLFFNEAQRFFALLLKNQCFLGLSLFSPTAFRGWCTMALPWATSFDNLQRKRDNTSWAADWMISLEGAWYHHSRRLCHWPCFWVFNLEHSTLRKLAHYIQEPFLPHSSSCEASPWETLRGLHLSSQHFNCRSSTLWLEDNE